MIHTLNKRKLQNKLLKITVEVASDQVVTEPRLSIEARLDYCKEV
jgi:hypothetical protein